MPKEVHVVVYVTFDDDGVNQGATIDQEDRYQMGDGNVWESTEDGEGQWRQATAEEWAFATETVKEGWADRG